MARSDTESRITLSVLDRLIDYEPGMSREAPSTRARNLRQLKQAVRRDLEWLLNSRQRPGGVPDGLPELRRSLAAYGLPDMSSFSVKSSTDQAAMRRVIEKQIEIFEPRLRSVAVTLETAEHAERALKFRIDANLLTDPVPEPVTFDTVLQLASGEYEVREK